MKIPRTTAVFFSISVRVLYRMANNMRIKTVLWDWNGTLLDDVELCFRTINGMLRRRGLRGFASIEEYRHTFRFPVEDYYRQAGFDFEKESFISLAAEYMSIYQPASLRCTLREGTRSVLERLENEGVSQLVLSASERRNLLMQAENCDVSQCFERLLGIDDVFARSKLHIAMKWLEESGAEPSGILLIGDTAHDCEVARAIGCGVLLLCGGHQDRERLEACGCQVVESTGKILDYVLDWGRDDICRTERND